MAEHDSDDPASSGTAGGVWVTVLPDLAGFGRRLVDKLGHASAGTASGVCLNETAAANLDEFKRSESKANRAERRRRHRQR